MKLGIILACVICVLIFVLDICAAAFIAKNMENFADMFNVDYADEPDNTTKV